MPHQLHPVALLFALDRPATVPAREWLRVVPNGRFDTVDGRSFLNDRPAEVVAAGFGRMARLPVDENHSTQLAAKAGGEAPARGWITELAARDDGIHALVEWTAAGQAMRAEGAYAYLSPVFAYDPPTGRVLALRSVALTNQPAVPELALLTEQEDNTVDLKALRAALGLPETADAAAIVAACTAQRESLAATTAHVARLTAAAGAEAGAAVEAVEALLTARRAAGDPAELRATVQQLEARLTAVQAQGRRRDAVALVDAAIRQGKPVIALRDRYIARCVAGGTEDVTAELAALPSIHSGGIVAPAEGAEGEAALTAIEREVVAKMGLTPAEFLVAKKKGVN